MSLVRDLVAAFSANDDGLLGLFGAFAYDLVFQIEDLVQKRPREKDQRDIVLYVPDRLLAYDRATGRGVVLSYDFAWKGKSTEALPRETADSLYLKTPRQGFADHAPGEYQATVETDRWQEQRNGSVRIEQVIYVERESQRKIVLGKGGQTIKSIGAHARREIAEMVEAPVHLFLFVKVQESWESDRERYRAMGLEFPKD